MSEREMTLRYLWEQILDFTADGEMDEARKRETFYSAVEAMTDGEYLAVFCAEYPEEIQV